MAEDDVVMNCGNSINPGDMPSHNPNLNPDLNPDPNPNPKIYPGNSLDPGKSLDSGNFPKTPECQLNITSIIGSTPDPLGAFSSSTAMKITTPARLTKK